MGADETIMKGVKDLGKKEKRIMGFTAFHPDNSHYNNHFSNFAYFFNRRSVLVNRRFISAGGRIERALGHSL